jgi:hypothetical protein
MYMYVWIYMYGCRACPSGRGKPVERAAESAQMIDDADEEDNSTDEEYFSWSASPTGRADNSPPQLQYCRVVFIIVIGR